MFSNVNGDAYNNRLFSEPVKLVNFVTFYLHTSSL